MTVPYLQVSGDAKRALEEFDSQFDGALAANEATPWAQALGFYKSSNAILTTYPVPVSAAGYVEEEGDDQLRSLYARSLSMKSRTWVDGFAEKARVVEAPDFIGWGTEPERIALESRRHPNKMARDMLAEGSYDGPLLDFYSDRQLGITGTIRMFSNAHPVNVFDTTLGTFQNYATASAINADMFRALFLAFRTRKAANGETMGLRPTHLLVPSALEQSAKDFLESDLARYAFLAGGSNTQETAGNRFRNIVQLVVADELTSDAYTYAIDATASAKPWILQDGGEIERMTLDKSSALYERTGKVGMKFKLEMNIAGCLPHAIQRVQITG